MTANAAALLSAAIRAAVLAKAPRRTVKAFAAAVTSVLTRPLVASAASPPETGTGKPGKVAPGAPGDACDELVQRLREVRAAKRRAKRQRRKAAKAAAPTPDEKVAGNLEVRGDIENPGADLRMETASGAEMMPAEFPSRSPLPKRPRQGSVSEGLPAYPPARIHPPGLRAHLRAVRCGLMMS